MRPVQVEGPRRGKVGINDPAVHQLLWQGKARLGLCDQTRPKGANFLGQYVLLDANKDFLGAQRYVNLFPRPALRQQPGQSESWDGPALSVLVVQET